MERHFGGKQANWTQETVDYWWVLLTFDEGRLLAVDDWSLLAVDDWSLLTGRLVTVEDTLADFPADMSHR